MANTNTDSIRNIEARDRETYITRVSFRFREKSNYCPRSGTSRRRLRREKTAHPLLTPFPKLKTRYASNGWNSREAWIYDVTPAEAEEQWLLFCLFTLARELWIMPRTGNDVVSRYILSRCVSRSIRPLENSKVFFIQTSFPEFLVSR